MKLCVSKETGKIYRPSYPDHWNDGHAIAATFSGKSHFYFREIVWKKYFWKFGKWVDTGEIWEPESGAFDVVESNEIIK